MTSTCIFRDTLRNNTQVFLKFGDSIFESCLHLINSNFTSYFPPSSMLSSGAGTSKEIPLKECGLSLPAIPISFSFYFSNSVARYNVYSISFIKFNMASNISIHSAASDVFLVEQLSNEESPQGHNSPNILNSTELSENQLIEMPSVSSIESPEPQIVTLNDDSDETTMPYGFRRQLPIIPPSLNDLNLLPNPFNILAKMAVVNQECDNNNSPHSPEPSEPSPISTPPMNVSTFDSWETSHTTTDDNTFYSDEESRRIKFLPITPTPPSPPRKLKRKMSLGMSFPKRGGVSQHVCEACGQMIPSAKDISCPSTKN